MVAQARGGFFISMAKLQPRNEKGQFAKSTDRYTFKIDSSGSRKYFDRGKRINAPEWKAVKRGMAILAKEEREHRKAVEAKRRDEHRKQHPVQAEKDPGHVTSSKHYQYYAEGHETAIFDSSGNVDIRARIQDAIDPTAHGAAQGNHVKDMGITYLPSVVSLDDAANQLLDFLLDGNGSVSNVHIDAVYWVESKKVYAVEWYYDFSDLYSSDPEDDDEE